ncbi:MAG TPA: SDR family NAD(P)-dependent oxidoreductase [Actinomycetota bacterium]|nr:SDR family NAD(P)-dependent oxidoreductase [Actinomycetota bacterium]
MNGLAGKGVLVSGGSRGIGRAAAQRFLEEGANVFVGGLEPQELASTVADLEPVGRIQGLAGDISREDDVAELVDAADAALGGIDILINNAGIAWKEPFLEITPEHWDRMLEVNLRGMFLVGQAVARRMVEAGRRGAVVNMASTNGLGGEADFAHYNASKAGVVLLTKTMAVELGRLGIRVNCVCPGFIDTPLNEGLATEEEMVAYGREKVPLGRRGRAEEVAAAYAFLASDEASFVHGEALVVDGGQTAVM